MQRRGELISTVVFGAGLLAALATPTSTVVVTVVTVAILAVLVARNLGLALRTNTRDRYYLALPILYGAFSFAAIQPLQRSPFVVLLIVGLILLYFGLYRSLDARKSEPRVMISLHQNSYLFCSWVCLVVAVVGLFGSLDHSIWELLFTNLLLFALVYALIQSLLFYVRIAPWQHRFESLIGAFGVIQFTLIQSLSTINPLITAGLCFMLFYVFWGITYHALKKLLTRRLLYEYLLMGMIGIGFLLVFTQLHFSA